MLFGYCRVSTPRQSIDRQTRAIRAKYKEAVLVTEEYTGRTLNRPQWRKLRNRLQPGDKVVFDSVSRMARNADEGWAEYIELFNAGVELEFLNEPSINTSVYRGAAEKAIPMTGGNVDVILQGINAYLKLLAEEQVRIAFAQAEKEVLDLSERTKGGIETARLNGKQIGSKPGSKHITQKSITGKWAIWKYSRDFEGTLNDIECMALTKLSRVTFYKYKREIKEQGKPQKPMTAKQSKPAKPDTTIPQPES